MIVPSSVPLIWCVTMRLASAPAIPPWPEPAKPTSWVYRAISDVNHVSLITLGSILEKVIVIEEVANRGCLKRVPGMRDVTDLRLLIVIRPITSSHGSYRVNYVGFHVANVRNAYVEIQGTTKVSIYIM